MGARLQRHISRRAPRSCTRGIKCLHFRMWTTARLRPAPCDDAVRTPFHKDATYRWIGRSRAKPPLSQTQRSFHMLDVDFRLGQQAVLIVGVFTPQLAQYLLKVAGLAEVLIDRRKPNIGHSIQGSEAFHYHLANQIGRDLAFAGRF